MMKDKLLRFVREHHLISPGDTVTCAVSGGGDSMAMLWALYSLREKLQISVRCAHFNHGMRENAALDEAFVREFCRKHAIPFQCGHGHVKRDALPGESPELAARRLRYDYLNQAAGVGLLATAHTADDNLETLLLRLTRGTSLRGLGGIPVKKGSVIRPMLFATRDDILTFLKEEEISFREDESNLTDFCPRNRIRHHVVPHLQAENPGIAQSALALSHVLREEDAFLSQLAERALAEATDEKGYLCKALTVLSPVLQRRVLFSILEKAGVSQPTQRHLAQLSALLHSDSPSAKANFPGGIVLQRNYDRLCIVKKFAAAIPLTPLKIPGITPIPGTGMRIVCTGPKKIKKNENSPTNFVLRCDMIDSDSLTVRSRQTGDRIQLPGGSRSLKRLMIDRKIPVSHRERMPVLADKNGIAAVVGIGADVHRAATPGMDAIQIKIEKEETDHDARH